MNYQQLNQVYGRQQQQDPIANLTAQMQQLATSMTAMQTANMTLRQENDRLQADLLS